MLEELTVPDEKLLKKIQKVLKKNKKFLMQFHGVRDVGVGFKFSLNKIKNIPCIVVFVSKKFKEDELQYEQKIPSEIDNILVDVIESNPKRHSLSDPNGLFDSLKGGISISNPKVNLAGTMGAIVFDNETNESMALTNFHVLFAAAGVFRTIGKSGDQIVQPALSSSLSQNVVGTLVRGNRNVDAAVFKISGRGISKGEINGFGEILRGTTSALLGMDVKKSGSSTGITYGKITAITNSNIRISKNPSRAVEGRLSSSGDSGSLWVTDSSEMKAVALHWGGEHDLVDVAHAVPINLITNKLNIHF